MGNYTILPNAFDYPVVIPSGGDFLGAVDIATYAGGNLLDNFVQMIYRARQYSLVTDLVLTGSAHRDEGVNPSYHEEWTWSTSTSPADAFAKSQDDTTIGHEYDFISSATRSDDGIGNYQCRATTIVLDVAPLIGGVNWTYIKTITLDGVTTTLVDEEGTIELYLLFDIAWAPGTVSGSVARVYPPTDFPSIVGNSFAAPLRFGAFMQIDWPSPGIAGVETPWTWSPSCVYPYDSGAHPLSGGLNMILDRSTFDFTFGIESDLTPADGVVMDTDTHSLSFTMTPNLSFPWT